MCVIRFYMYASDIAAVFRLFVWFSFWLRCHDHYKQPSDIVYRFDFVPSDTRPYTIHWKMNTCFACALHFTSSISRSLTIVVSVAVIIKEKNIFGLREQRIWIQFRFYDWYLLARFLPDIYVKITRKDTFRRIISNLEHLMHTNYAHIHRELHQSISEAKSILIWIFSFVYNGLLAHSYFYALRIIMFDRQIQIANGG